MHLIPDEPIDAQWNLLFLQIGKANSYFFCVCVCGGGGGGGGGLGGLGGLGGGKYYFYSFLQKLL